MLHPALCFLFQSMKNVLKPAFDMRISGSDTESEADK